MPDDSKTETAPQVRVQPLVRPEIAIRYRVRALALSWRSSALWKHHDAEMSDDETEKIACRREAGAFEVCAGHLEQACRDWPNVSDQRRWATETRTHRSLE